MNLSPYAKAVVATVVAALIAGLTALGNAVTDSKVEPSEWIVIVLAVLGAIGVLMVPNKPN